MYPTTGILSTCLILKLLVDQILISPVELPVAKILLYLKAEIAVIHAGVFESGLIPWATFTMFSGLRLEAFHN